MADDDVGTATVEDVADDVHNAPAIVEEPAADLVHDAADASDAAAEDAHDSARAMADASADVVHDTEHVAQEHEMHAETRRIVAEGFERVEGRLSAVEHAVGIGAEQPAEEAIEIPSAIVEHDAEPAAEETQQTITRRRRVFGKSRRS